MQECMVPMKTQKKPDLTPEQARDLTDRCKKGLVAVQFLLLEIQERNGHKALGYSSWTEYAEKEFGVNRNFVYKICLAAKMAREVGDPHGLSTLVGRALHRLHNT